MPLQISGKLSLPITGTPAANAQIRFRAVTAVGEIIPGAESIARCDASGRYSISIEFARYELATKISTPDFVVHGQVTIDASTNATDLEDLIEQIGIAPVLSDQLIAEFEALKNAAEDAAKRAEAAASSVDEMLYAMNASDFEANMEANKRLYAGSGSLHNPKILSAVAKGVKGALYFPADTANTLIHGENEYNVNGVVFTVEQMNIKLPPAPNGTKTYDSATGTITKHSSVDAAFSAETETNKVITSRKDLIFIEAWDEDTSEKGVIYPLGNVQYGLSTYEGIPLKNNHVAQGYSAFGEWDTETKGYSARISDLTFVQLCKFLQDPKNNLRYDAETRKLMQTRFRRLVIEGFGDHWGMNDIGVLPATHSYLGYAHLARVTAQGKRVEPQRMKNPNISAVNDTFVSTGYGSASPLDKSVDANIYQLRSDSGNKLNEICVSNCYALPIALVQRMNKGACHPVYNPMGCAKFSDSKSWYETSDVITSTKDCFVKKSGGAIGSVSGRPSNDPYQFYDAIYAGQVEDLRLSAHKQDLNRLREDAVRRAVAGTLRGKGKVPFTVVGQSTMNGSVYDQGFTKFIVSGATTTLPTLSSVRYGPGYNTDFKACVISNSGSIYSLYQISTRDDLSHYVYLDKIHGDVTSEFQSGTYWVVLSDFDYLLPEFDILPWADIIGHPERIAATFHDGVVGQWVPQIPDGTSKLLPLNRKTITTENARTYTTDDGATWTSTPHRCDPKTNSINYGLASSAVAIYQYMPVSEQTLPAKRSELVSGPSDVIATNSHEVSKGNRLHGSLIGTVGKGSSVDTATHTNIRDTGNKYNPVEISPQNETDALIAEMGLIFKNGLIYGQFAAKQAVHNGADWGDNQIIPKVDNETTDTDDNGETVKVVNHHTILPLGIASYTDSAMAKE